MKRKKYDLVACDIDGTLLAQSEELTHEHARLRALILEHDIPFTFVSGRSWPGLVDLVSYFQVNLPVVGNNGGAAYLNGELLWSHTFPWTAVHQAIMTAHEMDMAIIFTVGNEEFAYDHNAYIQHQIETFNRYEKEWKPSEAELSRLELAKLLIIDPERPGRIDQVLSRIAPAEAENLHIVRYNARSVDITDLKANKAQGLKDLKSYLKAEHVLAFGDDLNDCGFLQAADLGDAVANAHPQLTAVADLTTKENSVSGVLEVLEDLFRNGEEEGRGHA